MMHEEYLLACLVEEMMHFELIHGTSCATCVWNFNAVSLQKIQIKQQTVFDFSCLIFTETAAYKSCPVPKQLKRRKPNPAHM